MRQSSPHATLYLHQTRTIESWNMLKMLEKAHGFLFEPLGPYTATGPNRSRKLSGFLPSTMNKDKDLSPSILQVNKQINLEAHHYLHNQQISVETETGAEVSCLSQRTQRAKSLITNLGLRLPSIIEYDESRIGLARWCRACKFTAEELLLKKLTLYIGHRTVALLVELHKKMLWAVSTPDLVWVRDLLRIKRFCTLDVVFEGGLDAPEALSTGADSTRLLRALMLRDGLLNTLLSPTTTLDLPGQEAGGRELTAISDARTEKHLEPQTWNWDVISCYRQLDLARTLVLSANADYQRRIFWMAWMNGLCRPILVAGDGFHSREIIRWEGIGWEKKAPSSQCRGFLTGLNVGGEGDFGDSEIP